MTSRSMRALLALLLLACLLTSCQTLSDTVKENPKAVLGSLGGAGAGAGIAALAGASPAWIVGSALMGGLLGGVVGKSLDERDKEKARLAAYSAFEKNQTGQTTAWNNPDTGNSGSVTPTRTYQLKNGQYCREYQQSITVGGETHEAFGTACRQPDGTWKIES
jgi:surface antigen